MEILFCLLNIEFDFLLIFPSQFHIHYQQTIHTHTHSLLPTKMAETNQQKSQPAASNIYLPLSICSQPTFETNPEKPYQKIIWNFYYCPLVGKDDRSSH